MIPGPALPSFSRHPDTPSLPGGQEYGAAIHCPPVISLAIREPFVLHGTFTVPKDDALSFQEHTLQAAVVLLRGPMPETRNVGFRQLLFDEDLVDAGESVSGYFNLDLFELFDLSKEPNRYWVNASIFQYVSNTVTVEVTA